ncbi:MAG: hypothetical protein K2H74_06060 [Paramuribaculum sp.]|nr:hypothetical protein [Paramuribaculum sp.]
MRKSIIIFLTILSTTILKVGAVTDNESKIEELKAQVDSLSHEVLFIKLSYGLQIIQNELNIFTGEVNSKIMEISMDVRLKNCSRNSYLTYTENYEIFRDSLELYKSRYKSQQSLVYGALLYRNWNDNEYTVLNGLCNYIDLTYQRAELVLNTMKEMLELYHKLV